MVTCLWKKSSDIVKKGQSVFRLEWLFTIFQAISIKWRSSTIILKKIAAPPKRFWKTAWAVKMDLAHLWILDRRRSTWSWNIQPYVAHSEVSQVERETTMTVFWTETEMDIGRPTRRAAALLLNKISTNTAGQSRTLYKTISENPLAANADGNNSKTRVSYIYQFQLRLY